MTTGIAHVKQPKGSLPTGWAIADLQSIAQINPIVDKTAYDDSLPVSFVPMTAVEAGTGHMDVSTTRRLGEVRTGYTPFREGDVLFAKITPCMENGKIGVVPSLSNDLGFGSTEFHVLRPHLGISARFLYYFVSSLTFRRDAEHNMTGAVGQRRVPTPYFARHSIPVPPSAEQSRIVASLDALFSELNSGLDSLQTVGRLLRVYRQAVLKHAFERREIFSSGSAHQWPTVPLGELLSHLTSGSRGWARYYSPEGQLFIRAQNLKHDSLSLDDIAYVALPPGERSEGTRTRVQVGDVLITITGANVTKAGLVTTDLGTAYVSQHVALARPTSAILPEFLHWYLIAEAGGRRQLNAAAYGAGKPGLNLDSIRSVRVPLPTPTEQRNVVQTIRRLLSLADRADADLLQQLRRGDALREAILRTAFDGRLVKQDPADEPAELLLSRLGAEKDDTARHRRAPSRGRRTQASRKRKSAA